MKVISLLSTHSSLNDYCNWNQLAMRFGVSQNCVELVSQMLEKDLKKRLTMKQVLNHPFLALSGDTATDKRTQNSDMSFVHSAIHASGTPNIRLPLSTPLIDPEPSPRTLPSEAVLQRTPRMQQRPADISPRPVNQGEKKVRSQSVVVTATPQQTQRAHITARTTSTPTVLSTNSTPKPSSQPLVPTKHAGTPKDTTRQKQSLPRTRPATGTR